MKRVVILTMASLFFLSQFLFGGDNFGKFEKSLLKMTEFPDDADADAVIMMEEGVMKINPDFSLSFDVHKRIKILTEEGKKYGKIEIPYWEKDDVNDIKAVCYLPNGKKIKMNKKKDITKEKFGHTIKITILLPGVEVGSVIEYKYRLKSDYLWAMEPWYFQHELYTVSSKISVHIMEGFEYGSFFMNIPGVAPDPEVEEYKDFVAKKKYSRYTWELEDLPAIPEEPYMTTVEDYRTSLHFQIYRYRDSWNYKEFVKDWNSLSNELLENYKMFLKNKGFVNKLTHQLSVSDSLKPSEKLKIFYDYISKKIGNKSGGIYVDVDLTGEKILKKGEASRTEKNLMLIVLARQLGLKADPVVISTRSHGQIYKNLPRLDQFNRTIARIQEGFRTYFLDAGSPDVPFKVLPQSDLIPEGFWLQKINPQFVKLRSKVVKNYIKENTKIQVVNEDSLKLNTTVVYSGYQAYVEKAKLRKKSYQILWGDRLKDVFSDYHLDTLIVNNEDENRVEVRYILTVPNNIQMVGGKMYVEFPGYNKFKENPFKREKRYFPVDYSFFGDYEITIEFELPTGYKLLEKPENIMVNINGARLRCDVNENEKSLVFHRILSVKKLRFKQNEYGALRNLYQRTVDGDKMTVVLSKGGI